MVILENFLRQLTQTNDISEIQQLIVGLRDSYNVVHAVYHWVSADGEQYGFGTYDPIWAQRYAEKDYLRVDPVVIGCFQHFKPMNWNDLDWSSRASKSFLKDALSHGVGTQGFAIPIRGPNGQFAIFSLNHTCEDHEWSDFTAEHQRDLILIAHYLNQKALDFEAHRVPEPSKPLSPREIDTLTFLSMGYSRGQVAEMLSISEHTLRAYIEGARLKLNAQNTIHAVARAVSEGKILVGGAARQAQGGWPGRDEASSLQKTH